MMSTIEFYHGETLIKTAEQNLMNDELWYNRITQVILLKIISNL